MKTKTAITESELVHVRERLTTYRQAKITQSGCIFDLAEILRCELDYAHQLLEQSMLAENILYEQGLEIAPDDKPSLRVIDYEEETYFPRTIGSVEIVLAGCVIACFVAVIAGAGVAWDWVFGGEW